MLSHHPDSFYILLVPLNRSNIPSSPYIILQSIHFTKLKIYFAYIPAHQPLFIHIKSNNQRINLQCVRFSHIHAAGESGPETMAAGHVKHSPAIL